MSEIITSSAKADRFKRIAEKRTNNVLAAIRLLSQCSNKRSYEYTDTQVNKILKEIQASVKDLERKFKEPKAKTGFKL